MIRGRLALYIFTNSFQFSVKSLLSLKRKFTSFPQAAKAACGVLSGERPGRPAGKTIGVEPGDLRPVHQLPPSLEVVSPPVLVLEVVGVLPHVTAQQGHQRQGRVLVGGLLDGQTALPVGGQPGPAGAELSQGCLPHGGLQPRQTAEGPEDGPLQRRFGGGGRQGVEGAEVQAVVVYAPGVVPDALAELLRQPPSGDTASEETRTDRQAPAPAADSGRPHRRRSACRGESAAPFRPAPAPGRHSRRAGAAG